MINANRIKAPPFVAKDNKGEHLLYVIFSAALVIVASGCYGRVGIESRHEGRYEARPADRHEERRAEPRPERRGEPRPERREESHPEHRD